MISLTESGPTSGPDDRADIGLPAKGVRFAMLKTECRDRLAAMMSLSLVLTVLPASSASAGGGLFRRPSSDAVVVPAQPQPYVAYRPVYPVPGTKPLYLSSYAGANYPSNAPGAVMTPTDFRVLTGRPPRPRWGWFGAGW